MVFDHFSKLFMLSFVLIAIFSFEFFHENTTIPQGVTNMGYFLEVNVTSYMFHMSITFDYKLHFR